MLQHDGMGSLETLGGLGVYFDDFRFFSIFGDSDPHFGLRQNAKNGFFGIFAGIQYYTPIKKWRKMTENRAKMVKKSIFQYFRPFLAYSDYFQKKNFFDDFSNFFFSQYAFFFSASNGPKMVKSAENAIFCVLREAKMGVRVTKNRKKKKIAKMHHKTPKVSREPIPSCHSMLVNYMVTVGQIR